MTWVHKHVYTRVCRDPGFKSCSQQRKTRCLLSIWISLACARASKLTTNIYMYIYIYIYIWFAYQRKCMIYHCIDDVIFCVLQHINGHYDNVIMSTIASQITNLAIVYSTVYSDADERKHQSSVSLAFVRRIHRGPVNSPHKGPVTRKMFPFDDVIMNWCEFRFSVSSF